MKKEMYMKLRIIPLTLIICAVFVIGYNFIHKDQLPYEADEMFLEEVPYFYTDKKSEEMLININTAEKEELEKLSGIGEATAEKIIELRNKLGRFTSEKQLLHINGISDSVFEKILPHITVKDL